MRDNNIFKDLGQLLSSSLELPAAASLTKTLVQVCHITAACSGSACEANAGMPKLRWSCQQDTVCWCTAMTDSPRTGPDIWLLRPDAWG